MRKILILLLFLILAACVNNESKQWSLHHVLNKVENDRSFQQWQQKVDQSNHKYMNLSSTGGNAVSQSHTNTTNQYEITYKAKANDGSVLGYHARIDTDTGEILSTQEGTIVNVLFQNEPDEEAIENVDGVVLNEARSIPVITAVLPEEEVKRLANEQTGIISIEKDQVVKAAVQQEDWGIEKVNGHLAWQSDYTGEGVDIAVIDSGIYPHEDLNIAGGRSFIGSPEQYFDDNGHGTHVAGIIGAENNQIGSVGLAHNATIYSLKVLDSNGDGYESDVISAIDWAITNEIDIINLSLGAAYASRSLKMVVDKANDQGILICAAAGNEGAATSDTIAYPARYPSVIAVTATTNANTRAGFSSVGNTAEVAAPGQSIYSTYLNNTYRSMSGTSMATPYVAANLALIKQANPDLSSSDIRKMLTTNVLDLGEPGRDTNYGYGLIQTVYGLSLHGATRYETGVKISRYGWEKGSTVVCLGRGDIPIDALTGSVIAKQYNAPLLLTKSTEIPNTIKSEIKRLNPQTIYLLGGEGAVSKSIESHLKGLGYEVHRIYGSSRYGTAVDVASHINQEVSEVFLVTGKETSPDPLSIAAYAGMKQIPILLTRYDTLPDEVSRFIKNEEITKVTIIGGEGVVSSNVGQQLKQLGVKDIERVAGPDRYQTSVEIVKRYTHNFDLSKVFFASGTSFIDALSGSPLAAMSQNPILLANPKNNLSAPLKEWLLKLNENKFVFLGGYGVIPIEIRAKIQALQ
ncbi:S8 family serine peptidase [Virgibacillus sp. MSP4-1]|uniref:S8 family serine peptidase n=1 Tax=Virgibacillus sp. MSP4-1 TaxID=2700081 RepID=UPI00039D0B8D|nr:S8 family serine peptidase [Virgibacillus sp. MSP4-1]QHS23654.1 S8 family serine peptidase [Virgibacillus sp. MSP4-1]